LTPKVNSNEFGQFFISKFTAEEVGTADVPNDFESNIKTSYQNLNASNPFITSLM